MRRRLAEDYIAESMNRGPGQWRAAGTGLDVRIPSATRDAPFPGVQSDIFNFWKVRPKYRCRRRNRGVVRRLTQIRPLRRTRGASGTPISRDSAGQSVTHALPTPRGHCLTHSGSLLRASQRRALPAQCQSTLWLIRPVDGAVIHSTQAKRGRVALLATS